MLATDCVVSYTKRHRKINKDHVPTQSIPKLHRLREVVPVPRENVFAPMVSSSWINASHMREDALKTVMLSGLCIFRG